MELLAYVCVFSRVRLCDPMDCRLPASSVHRISQARIMEWVAISYSRGSSWPRDWTQVTCFAGRVFSIWATREALISYHLLHNKLSPNLIHWNNNIHYLSVFIYWNPGVPSAGSSASGPSPDYSQDVVWGWTPVSTGEVGAFKFSHMIVGRI